MPGRLALRALGVHLLAWGQTAPPEDVSALCDQACRDNELPGCGLIVVKDGRIVAQGVAGVRRMGKSEPITLEDKFHLGSCTKAMTALVAAKLVDQGKLQWDSTIGEVLGKSMPEIDEGYRGATLLQLLGHRAGVPGKPPLLLWGRAWTQQQKDGPQKSRFDFAHGHLKLKPDHPPGTHYEYSNAGYTIAAVMMEQASGDTWEHLMQQHLFDPLKMTSAGYGAPATPNQQPADQPWGHRLGRPIPPGPAADNPDAIGPAGKVHANLLDLAQYALALLRNARGEAVLIAPETMQRVLTALPDQEYALGWIVADRPWAGGNAFTHSGSNTMNYLTIWLAPKRNLAIITATNCGNEKAPKALRRAGRRGGATFRGVALPGAAALASPSALGTLVITLSTLLQSRIP